MVKIIKEEAGLSLNSAVFFQHVLPGICRLPFIPNLWKRRILFVSARQKCKIAGRVFFSGYLFSQRYAEGDQP
jgi:hypothetical protein